MMAETSPGGDAATVRFPRDTDAGRLKQQKVPRPVAWTMPPADTAECSAKGEHCQARRCRNPVAIVTWRWWRSTEVGRVLVAEHFVCVQHGQEFAGRHHIQVEAAPSGRNLALGPPSVGGDPR
jgi:hypothetical protein